MRFIVMHKTDAHWEAGAVPSRELIGQVGSLLGEMAKVHGVDGTILLTEPPRATT